MSDQILLYGKLLGIEEFLLSGEDGAEGRSADRITLRWSDDPLDHAANEVLPRALLERFGFARILLGSSGGAQFLLVLPGEARPRQTNFSPQGRDVKCPK